MSSKSVKFLLNVEAKDTKDVFTCNFSEYSLVFLSSAIFSFGYYVLGLFSR